MNFEELEKLVLDWAYERSLFSEGDPKTQCLKLVSEVGELADGVAKGNMEEIIDGIGDSLVVIISLSKMLGLNPVDCLNHSYNVIKNRKGRMINGTFVKEE